MLSWKFRQYVSEAYVDWALFLSSYSPLPALLAIRLIGKCQSPSLWLGAVTIVMMLPLAHVLCELRSIGGRERNITNVSGAAGEVAGYIAGYILPLIVLDSIGVTDYVAYGVFIVIVGIVMTRGHLLHINPWIYLFGWHLYSVTVGDDDRFYLLARNEPQPGLWRTKAVRNRLLVMAE